MDDVLLDLITEVQFKISGENRLQMQAKKGEYKKRIKQQYDLQRKKLVS